MRLIIIEPKNWDGFEYSNPCLYKINNLSMLDYNIRQFGDQNITYVGENALYIKLKYPKVKVIENHIKNLTGDIYPLLLGLNQDISSTFITTSCIHIDDSIIKSMKEINCEFVDEKQNSIGVCHFDTELNNMFIKEFEGNYHQSISNLLELKPEIKRVSFYDKEVIKYDTSEEYLECFSKITNISFEELTKSNAEKLLKFYLKQPVETRNYYKPHSFELQELKQLADGPNMHLLAFRNGEVIGYWALQGMEFEGLPSFGYIVDEQEKGTGLAFAGGVNLIGKAKKMGLDGVIGNLSVTNFAAIKSDKRLGFEFKFIKNSRIYVIIDFYKKGLKIPAHYIEKTCIKKETSTW